MTDEVIIRITLAALLRWQPERSEVSLYIICIILHSVPKLCRFDSLQWDTEATLGFNQLHLYFVCLPKSYGLVKMGRLRALTFTHVIS